MSKLTPVEWAEKHRVPSALPIESKFTYDKNTYNAAVLKGAQLGFSETINDVISEYKAISKRKKLPRKRKKKYIKTMGRLVYKIELATGVFMAWGIIKKRLFWDRFYTYPKGMIVFKGASVGFSTGFLRDEPEQELPQYKIRW